MFMTHLRLLLWKNTLLQRRKVYVTIFEVVLPILFACLFFAVRTIADLVFHDTIVSGSVEDIYDISLGKYEGIDNEMILYTPNNALVNSLMATVHSRMSQGREVTFKGFQTEPEMLDYFRLHPEIVSNGIVFPNVQTTDTSLKKRIPVQIRPYVHDWGSSNASIMGIKKVQHWRTTETMTFQQIGIPMDGLAEMYWNSGFLYLQRAIQEAIILHFNASANDTLNNLEIKMQRTPFPPYVKDPMIALLQNMFPMLLVLSFILVAIQTTKSVVYEKEKKLKESMKLMGMNPSAHWVSWFITTFLYILSVMAVYTLFCGVNATGKGAPLARTSPSLFFFFLLCYGLSIISFCFMISVFTQKANVGAAVCGIVFFLSYFPYFYLDLIYHQMSRSAKLSGSLAFNLAMAFGAKVIALSEGAGTGMQWSNFHEPASVDDNYSLSDSMLMLLGDSLIYLTITWYFDNILPGDFGVPNPFYFFFTKTYWVGSKRRDTIYPALKQDKNRFEKEPTGSEIGISVRELRKVFGKGGSKKIAVDNMTINMFVGQITVLLGHNGAGKTTTMSMLTGFMPSTGGTAIVNGYDINNDIQGVRKSLGLCPQHDILFDSLTVEEHLDFFATLKGCPRRDIEKEVEHAIEETGLQAKRYTQSQHLSGGQKRKLSVAIALIAGSKIVILDEPTTGMDPAARRQTWDILQKNRKGRTIMLTTHFMDEADLLGDRIAIMAEGEVKCCGSSYFLKKCYGAGYHLVIVKGPKCLVPNITSFIQSFVPSAIMESEINAELSYLLPEEDVAKFPELFTKIEHEKKKLGISSFGASATTMEEVFLSAGQSGLESMDAGDQAANQGEKGRRLYKKGSSLQDIGLTENVLAFNEGYTRHTGFKLQFSRFKGMFIKKLLHTFRNRYITMVQIVLPAIFTMLSLFISKIEPANLDQISLKLHLDVFRGTHVPYQPGYPVTALTGSLGHGYVNQMGSSDKPENIDFSLLANANSSNTLAENMTAYFLKKSHRIGYGTYNQKLIIGASFHENSSSPEGLTVVGYYNRLPFHAAPISMSYLLNSILKHFTSEEYSVTFFNNPLPYKNPTTTRQSATSEFGIAFSVALCLMFGMAFLAASFVYFLIKERQVGAKHLQVLSGVGPVIFWLSNITWDYINYLLTTLLLVVVFASFNSPAYSGDGRLWVVTLLLMSYGIAVLPFMYVIHYIFESPATGFVLTITINILTGIATLMTTFMLQMVQAPTKANICDTVFMVFFPHYSLSKSVMNLQVNKVFMDLCARMKYPQICLMNPENVCCDQCDATKHFCMHFVDNIMEWENPGIGRYIAFMFIQGAFYMTLTLAIEYRLPIRIWKKIRPTNKIGVGLPIPDEEEDVAAERIRADNLQSGAPNSDALILRNLHKKYGKFVAVDQISVGIPEKECFGLLGQNGAGKTTTFKILTGDVMTTLGNAYLWSYDIRTQKRKVQEHMGYCPQFDALIDQMTGRESLTLFARLKGIPEKNIKVVCQRLLEIVRLKRQADKLTSEYSGGKKRMLSTAIALIGDPAFIMLDEPSSGMDPKSRRVLWNLLSRVRAYGRTLILTSHSMEECDALCTRLAIMVNGRFVCLGTPQHLKNKFGQGYTLIARMGMLEDGQVTAPVEPLVEYISNKCPGTQMFDDHQGYAHFQVPDKAVTLGEVFSIMERAKSELNVEDYSVHQTTLEQVFLSFTRGQVAPKEIHGKPCCKKDCCSCCFRHRHKRN